MIHAYLSFLCLGGTLLGADLNNTTSNLPPAGHGRSHQRRVSEPMRPMPIEPEVHTFFEPHLRRIEEDVIRQMSFKVSVRNDSTDKTIKITVRGFLRDKQVLKQGVDITM